MSRKLLLGSVIVSALFTTLLMSTGNVYALNTTGFNAGRIIDDAIFYDSDGMGGVNEVQSFLNAHVPACDTMGTQPSGYGNLNNAQYAQQVQGWPGPPYACLNNYYENPTTGETSFEKGGGSFSGGISAAQIIYDAARAYNINPKVLLVTLRKESLNLFSDSWPLKSQYKYAMGYACPDSGPNYSANCQASKAGFYNQMTYAAWQLRYYYDHMGSYNYAPGRWNTIQYSPDVSCGTKDVYIENYATASLYIYTPYTPNDAALNSYPGTAACGAYGNRNFWFFWNEWFGSTLTNGNFVRSVGNATVYLVGDKIKYPISDINLVSSASGLGGIGYVSQAYLDSIPTGPLLSRFIKGTDGTIYYYDSNIKLPFSSCAMLEAYGGDCASVATLTQPEINKFISGPPMTRLIATTNNKLFYMSGGTKREVFDAASLTQAGINDGVNVLTESALSGIPYGPPIIKDNVFLRSRTDNLIYVYTTGSTVSSIAPQLQDSYLDKMTLSRLDVQSINAMSRGVEVGGYLQGNDGSRYILTSIGKVKLTSSSDWSDSFTLASDGLLSQIPDVSTASAPYTIKGPTPGSTIYLVQSKLLRPISSWSGLLTLNQTPNILIVPPYYLNTLTPGSVMLSPGSLVVSRDSATVYLVDGLSALIPLSTFDPAIELGFGPIVITSSEAIGAYAKSTRVLDATVQCGANSGIAIGKNVYPIPLINATYTTLSSTNCSMLMWQSTAPSFLIATSGTIFQIQNGVKQPISSYGKYLSLGGNSSNTIRASNYVLRYFADGPLL